MNFHDELRNLDINDPGRWPVLFHALAIGLFFIILSVAGYYFLVQQEQSPKLERAEAEERELKRNFEQKQRKAANFDAYSAQLAEIERSFGTMLRQLPGRTEIPNLLVDISQTGLAAGLQEELFQPLDEVRREFYAEKPIRMRLSGSYHQLGQFVSDIAALPRIVTLHDIEIGPRGRDAGFDELTLNVTAKTYRYLDEDEIQEAVPGQQPRGRQQRAPARRSGVDHQANPG
jgi:type IV pilus assembly protein PilO